MSARSLMERPAYVLKVRAEPGVNDIRALRAWLKIGLRTFGLRCVEIEQSNRRVKMDMRKYSAGVIKPEDLHEGPQLEKVVDVSENDKYGCAVLHFESGRQLYCWNNYARILTKAWGYESEHWIDQELECSLGHYTDRKTDTEKETVDIRPISPAKPGAFDIKAPGKAIAPGGGAASLRNVLDDDIPFAPEWR
jgi:hypothetical protein